MIKIVCVGKIKEKSLKDLIDEYFKRIHIFSNIEIIEIKDISIPKKSSDLINEDIKNKEGIEVLKKINDKDYVILLDLKGKEFDSIEISKKIDEIQTNISSNICFVIGGSLGVSDELIKRANIRWCLSKCTFPHQVVRLLVVEQIYRSFTILNNTSYHK